MRGILGGHATDRRFLRGIVGRRRFLHLWPIWICCSHIVLCPAIGWLSMCAVRSPLRLYFLKFSLHDVAIPYATWSFARIASLLHFWRNIILVNALGIGRCAIGSWPWAALFAAWSACSLPRIPLCDGSHRIIATCCFFLRFASLLFESLVIGSDFLWDSIASMLDRESKGRPRVWRPVRSIVC